MKIISMNQPMNDSQKEQLDERLEEELEERVEFGCWSTNCSVCNDRG